MLSLRHYLTISVSFVSIVAVLCTDDEVGLLIDIVVVRVKVLSVVIVEDTCLSIVLHSDLHESLDVSWANNSYFVAELTTIVHTWSVHNLLHISLLFVLSGFN